MYDVIIIGAGASGMMAAVTAAKKGLRVLLLEVEERVGKKILATGNGKCNMTNLHMEEKCFRSSSGNDIMQVINSFDNRAVIDFFFDEGLITRDRDGYVYPYSEQASSVLDTLRKCLNKYGVEVIVPCKVMDINKKTEFVVKTDMANYKAANIIIATGTGAGLKKTPEVTGLALAKRLGHGCIKQLPALTALICDGKFFKEISGVRAKAAIDLYIDGKKAYNEYGELQLTDYGISGIPVFQLSRFAVKALDGRHKVSAKIDFMPEYEMNKLSAFIKSSLDFNSGLSIADQLTGLVNKKIMNLLIKQCGYSPADKNMKNIEAFAKKLTELLKNFMVNVTGNKGIENAQVCQGGIPLNEIDTTTMESKLVKGLYFTGELLDVDGICGGYNLQWAWSSGYIAGNSIKNKGE